MTKQQILNEIRRTAQGNEGVPLGWRRFATETGIGEPDWKGKIWARWNDAVREAGFEPNGMTKPYGTEELVAKFAKLSLELGRLPTSVDIRLCVHNGMEFPTWETFVASFGGKPQLIGKLREHCHSHPELASVEILCDSYLSVQVAETEGLDQKPSTKIGFVYLMKSAKFYKIGKADHTGRRHRQLTIQLPERLIFVHEIKTDDPFGIEVYWHNRFADKRRGGEWFELNAADVAVFKRRKFM